MSVLDLFRLDDKVVIVTGASSGLGVAFARAFAEAGTDVALGARRVPPDSRQAATCSDRPRWGSGTAMTWRKSAACWGAWASR